jgi:Co/Zn/Cd efflux system component
MLSRQVSKQMPKPKSTRGRIALPGVGLRDRFIPLGVPVGCSEFLLVADFGACKQEKAGRVKEEREIWVSRWVRLVVMQTDAISGSLRRVVLIVAALNLGYFGVEFGVALAIGSVSLFADSVDFLEDASVNILIFLALDWPIRARARVGMAMAGILLVPAAAMLWVLWQKFNAPVHPAPVPLSLAGAGALAVNLACAFLLARFRYHSGSLTRAAFLSARNDAIANVAIVATGLVTAWTLSAWPDVIVGIAIALMNADAAREVWDAARKERQAAA